ncbi:alpha/beta fold hydrolase [Glaciecola sp. XM2]|uniref:alpha/beta fold hydrolase n=1 Tax=Glaciecola sp. XM2 TaxID=1914931 RepID=UPI001BDE4E66|nr:alpha/beta fold hydrolase [Glaciecola sp. XM2]MBT1451285.1 alpha/beta fold hydrolase [Glaciecola sp. XM2]
MFKVIHVWFVTLIALCFSHAALAQQSEENEADAQYVAQQYVSDVTSLVCPFKNDIDYEPERVRCGFITVPENREAQDSRLIRVAFTHIVAQARIEDEDAADEEEPLVVREDPVVYLTGGPGAGMEFYVGRFLEHDLTKTRDVYILNQRGIGDSEELCRYYSSTARENVVVGTFEEQQQESAQRMQACFETASARGVDLRGYNTVENAKDVRALRLALGFENWNVWGISYGSHLGQMLVNVDPEGIRALVLDAIVPNDLVDLMRLHRWIARNHRLIFDECERQGASICDGLEEAFYAAGDALLEEPLVVDALDKEIFPSGEVLVSPMLVAFAPFAMMYEQDGYPALPAVMRSLVDMVEGRDEQVFQGLVSGADVFSGISEGMGSAIRCNDGYMAAEASVAAEDLQEDFGFSQGAFSVASSQLMADTCVAAGLAPLARDDYQLIETDIPTLIVNGDWDPITPPPLAKRIAPGFRAGKLIIVPYAGHGPTRSMPECATQVMTDFFDDPTQNLDDLDTSCLEEGATPPEFLDFLQTHMPLKFAAMAAEDPKKLALPALSAATPVFVSLIGLIMICWGALTRRFSSSTLVDTSVGPASPRVASAVSAFLLLLGVGLIGGGISAAVEMEPISILAGFAPPAGLGALLVMLAGMMSVFAIWLTLKHHRETKIRRRSVIGFIIMALTTIIFTITMVMWNITPW